ncbi:chemotaxis protein CheA [Paenibacillus frigoriresistens]|uniref:chemotaxis protein CheA n=1 Tax=Paenibacillus alginolyticus TaxID=59839 RepID=UPI001566B800|nr:chemotaxis protein CheA [Paenibacillus frigoriresistens]NRF96072.1 chemotaxis protein CheA [Paenibacillus frigoriresistens]
MDSSYLLEITGVFLDEVEDQLQTMDQEILKLEQAGESEETIQSLFRAAHTLKGSSAAMGFEEMKQLTHEMEHILDQVRNHRLRVTNAMINLLFKCLDHLRILKEEFVVGAGISTEISHIVNELQRFSVDSKDLSEEGNEAVQESRFLSTGSLEVLLKIQEAQEQGLSVLDIHVGIAPDCPMKSARAYIILNQLDSWGDVLHTVPSLENLGEEEDSSLEGFQFLLASQAETSLVKGALLSIMDVADVRVSPYAPQHMESKADEVTAIESVMPKSTEKRTVNEEGKRKTQTIRVDVERLELLMNLVGELVIDQTRISQIGNVLHHRYTSDDNVEELGQISDHVSRVIGELQENVMKVRMLPIEQLFNRFPRMVRDLAQSLNKEIELVIEGKETELDRTVIEEIGDPLIHLIRNAVDHGIEPAEERKRTGKPLKGRLRITAAHEENQVVITVEDDGAGIDPVQIRNSALRKGVISEEEHKKLSDQEAIHLIFRAGFSTASSVSDVSGRGVGMDIVRDHIEKLSGVIDIETKLGEGTRFKIKLPLTLAIITGLLIKLNGRTFILPMSSIVEIVRMPLEAIQTIKGDSVVVIRERVLPVVWLHDYFHIPQMRQKKKQFPIVVVGTAEKRIALVVDELMGNQEIVVKSLGAYVGKIDCISGSTILGDGRVALILEVAGIGKMISRV